MCSQKDLALVSNEVFGKGIVYTYLILVKESNVLRYSWIIVSTNKLTKVLGSYSSNAATPITIKLFLIIKCMENCLMKFNVLVINNN